MILILLKLVKKYFIIGFFKIDLDCECGTPLKFKKDI